MKRFLLIIITGFIRVTSYSQDSTPGCGFIKTGNFVYLDSASNDTWNIKRTKHQQTEENEKNGLIIKQKIEWLSACEYKLTQTWANKKEWRKGNKKSRIYTITSISANTYYYRCNCSDGTKMQGAVVKIR